MMTVPGLAVPVSPPLQLVKFQPATGVGVSVTVDTKGVCTAARVGIGAVAPTVLLVPAAGDALIGSKLDDAALEKAGKACSAAASPISDTRGTADYRRSIVAVLCRRASKIAGERAKETL